MGLLVLAGIVVAGSLPTALHQMFGALRWKREQSEPMPLRFDEGLHSSVRGRSVLGTAYARTTTFIR